MTVLGSKRCHRFLVIDDDPVIGEMLGVLLGELGDQVEYCRKGSEGLERARELQPVVVLLDGCLPGEDGLHLLERVRRASPGSSVILTATCADTGFVVKAMKQGASDVLCKPLQGTEVMAAVESALEATTLQWEVQRLREQILEGQLERGRAEYASVFGNSRPMKAIKDMIDRVADTDATILVWGESGVGKELVAHTVHDCSLRRERAFVKINCAALPLELLESELFGYERGAFTGAYRRKPGKFELADKGTIFLDEIGEMPLPLQAKLLNVLQDREFARLGSGQDIKVDVRVVASTNKDLKRAVAEGAFREDLYYRLDVVNIHVPPLRERVEEIPVLAEHFLEKYRRQYNRHDAHLSGELLERFQAYGWPGNVRELENFVKRVVLLESEEFVPELHRRDGIAAAPAARSRNGAAATTSPRAPTPWEGDISLKDVARHAAHEAERSVIKQVLDEVRWNRVKAARRLKISYKALLYKIVMYELQLRTSGKDISADKSVA